MENRIPGGLLDISTEFFSVFNAGKAEAMCIHSGKTYAFNAFPKSQLQLISQDMKARPGVEKAIGLMVGLNEHDKLEQYIICRFGALNNEPDIDSSGHLSEPEYVPCNNRGTCPFEGQVCSALMVKTGVFLSRAETEVFKRVRLPDKNIADKLFISVETVKKHFQNIRKKTGLNTKIEMAIWATQKGII